METFCTTGRIFFGHESKQEVIKVVAILLKGIFRHACTD